MAEHAQVATLPNAARSECPRVIGTAASAQLATQAAARLGRPLTITAPGQPLVDALRSAPGRGSALVCLAEPEFTLAAVNELIDQSVRLRRPVGLLPVPPDEAAAADMVAKFGREPRTYPHRAALYCDFVAEWRESDDQRYGRVTSTQFMSRLAEGVDAAVIHAHGNGGDFRVGDHVLCVKVGRPADAIATARHLPCWGSRPVPARPQDDFPGLSRAWRAPGAHRGVPVMRHGADR